MALELVREYDKIRTFQEVKGTSTKLFRQHIEDEQGTMVEICEFRKGSIRYPYEGRVIKEIVFEGFKSLPPLINNFGFGFSEKSIDNFFKKRFDDASVSTLIISDKKKRPKANQIVFSTTDFDDLMTQINQEKWASNNIKAILITNFLVEHYPNLKFDAKEANSNKALILRNLNSKLIDQLTADEVEIVGKFYVQAAQKYSRPDVVKRMVLGLQKNAQLLTLQEVINTYEKLLETDPKEHDWQSFFDQYITLFDSRYAHKIDYKNIAVGLTKYPDLVLVDIYGYIDFYELKKSGMQLLQYDKNHNTFYWTKELSMTIAQASDYLQKAKENGVNFAKAIKVETETEGSPGVDVNIISPRAIIVAGSNKELNTPKKRNNFKNLRESLKDIEFILYDELLDRLKNLLSAIKIQ